MTSSCNANVFTSRAFSLIRIFQFWGCELYTCSSIVSVFRRPAIITLGPRQNGRHFADDTFKRIFLSENGGMSIKISLKFILKGPISNIPSLVEIMAWRRPGAKPLSQLMMVSLMTHICVTRPQWVIQNNVYTVYCSVQTQVQHTQKS